ncbi:MAG: class I SAM-dependent methyltransferase [Helicobacter sp.]|uniref:methyltransferase domain-containing protein n=1 Tax=Helicobacter sp. 10-6591 TaxID=2004998 RepID=UPI000DCE4323|nr:methyltransferase domain-containing protein [Helicobacter sp. 10-6591]MCI6218056.1 class I SAM-dependent methyltransferase [Helicobacter sp.]MCI7485609.1 class I SAM-dependent methyltransferase [Helicobacter sp.]MDD7567402.1 methyltransferase domain-containing protein [Helicobacter sp.]MDY5740503.1 methyltransferase domain-containing protein [Helicobacter sp.]RAX56051.1 hypothetical protein CCY97_01750 [Helicobacter sp. 10-6591]
MLDLGGGNGMLVRLLRDSGIQAFWEDKYCDNFYARGFEWERHKDSYPLPSLATSFEVFEHLANPKQEIMYMLELSPNLLFSTELLPTSIPEYSGDKQWWYYGFSHGQHISFFTHKSLESIAQEKNLYFCSYKGLHLFSKNKINQTYFMLIVKFANRGLYFLLHKCLQSKTQEDSKLLEHRNY